MYSSQAQEKFQKLGGKAPTLGEPGGKEQGGPLKSRQHSLDKQTAPAQKFTADVSKQAAQKSSWLRITIFIFNSRAQTNQIAHCSPTASRTNAQLFRRRRIDLCGMLI